MRFMLLLKGDPQVDATEGVAADAVAGPLPPTELIQGMNDYMAELVKAGVLLAAEGLFDSSQGARVVYANGRKSVVDGPFAEAKELVAGFYMIQVSSKEEAIEWAKRCPVELAVQGTNQEAVIEIRQVAEMDELPTATPEQIEEERRLREQLPS
ncbi:YciI family protein [Virgisporangium ochraceum]|uniref:YCII-related domain-containing protein n=1 Tax=Virgisporangium ochraceum TaxID=65505 RepID=A0A8J4EF37_9ACTN|nr:YciI family protein [Virgisporangium ochraceum]GIJ69627.1 hypothetical protein Voc01_045440 [Virgisporangium ochraceum]